jgi:hypothetical protein
MPIRVGVGFVCTHIRVIRVFRVIKAIRIIRAIRVGVGVMVHAVV